MRKVHLILSALPLMLYMWASAQEPGAVSGIMLVPLGVFYLAISSIVLSATLMATLAKTAERSSQILGVCNFLFALSLVAPFIWSGPDSFFFKLQVPFIQGTLGLYFIASVLFILKPNLVEKS